MDGLDCVNLAKCLPNAVVNDVAPVASATAVVVVVAAAAAAAAAAATAAAAAVMGSHHFLCWLRTRSWTCFIISFMSILAGQVPVGVEASGALQVPKPDRGADQDLVPEPKDEVEEADGGETQAGAATGAAATYAADPHRGGGRGRRPILRAVFRRAAASTSATWTCTCTSAASAGAGAGTDHVFPTSSANNVQPTAAAPRSRRRRRGTVRYRREYY